MSQRGYEVTTHVEFGEPTEQIVRLANELPAELIVIGHKRRTSLASRWWHNSVGASLLEQSPCSILMAVGD
jgi:nucleotide-binding universal stress UspA family protein